MFPDVVKCPLQSKIISIENRRLKKMRKDANERVGDRVVCGACYSDFSSCPPPSAKDDDEQVLAHLLNGATWSCEIFPPTDLGTSLKFLLLRSYFIWEADSLKY